MTIHVVLLLLFAWPAYAAAEELLRAPRPMEKAADRMSNRFWACVATMTYTMLFVSFVGKVL